MIDIHSHIIFDVDDGASTIDESLKMISEAEKLGIKVIFATPHYHEEIFKSEKVMEHFQKLVYKASDYDVTLKLGSEVFLNPMVFKKNRYKEMFTLGDSNSILLELPFSNIPVYSDECIYRLQIEGANVIIAHPERNRHFVNNFSKLAGFIERGCLLQLDAASILGVYGSRVKDFCNMLIKNKLVHFVASDAHYVSDYTERYCQAFDKVRRWAGQEYADKLFTRNAKDLLIESVQQSISDVI